MLGYSIFIFVTDFFACLFFETGFLCVDLVPILELALVDQAGLELTEICLLLPPQCWD